MLEMGDTLDRESTTEDMPPNVESALQYANRYGWALLPMRGKKFYTRDGARIATRDPNTIAQWSWAESIGMACGEPSGTDALDIDDVEAFAATGFDLEGLAASTLAASTPSGGRHLFFEFAGPRSRVFPWGEWRSTGLAVVLPPAPGRQWINDLKPAPLPQALAEIIRELSPSRHTGHSPSWSLVSDVRALPKPLYDAVHRTMPAKSRHDQRRVGGALRGLVHAKHHRNNALNRAAFCFRDLVAEDLITVEAAWSLLELASELNGYTAKDGIEAARATIASGLGYQRPGKE
jgi:hypothetical protein